MLKLGLSILPEDIVVGQRVKEAQIRLVGVKGDVCAVREGQIHSAAEQHRGGEPKRWCRHAKRIVRLLSDAG